MSRKTLTRPAHVWVVEEFVGGEWRAQWFSLTRDVGRAYLDTYRHEDGGKYRLRKYVRENPS